MATIYLSLGSNIGDRQEFLETAIAKLGSKITDIVSSSVYETEPWGNEDQESFLNICLRGQTSLSSEELLGFIKSVEKNLGRSHNQKWGPREIDIDILFYDNESIKSASLEIPHPYIAERAFVLIPLAEIAPGFIHPILKKSIGELASLIDTSGAKRLVSE